MSELSLAASLERAQARFERPARPRRSDLGKSRLPAPVEKKLHELLGARERPPVVAVWRAVDAWCRRHGLESPSRATVYGVIARVEPPLVALDDLPHAVRRCLHNVGAGPVPGQQVVFAAFNYGDPRALSFASGMPWPCLYRAARMPGFRAKSLGLLRAVMAYRGI